ncbi:sensor histidine kinase [Sulfitobacter sp. SK011]|uniref:sensor histidine kinase n=1 Tax=Sulfitobacter sp. SK011 TaxID=1389004 RepID=UPI0034A0B749
MECLPQDLQRVILNLCSNGMYEAAKQAASGGDAARLNVSTTTNDNRYLIKVTDNGGGIPCEMQDKIFNPFFTTKPSGEGTGLGLSISFDIIKQHGGELSFETRPGNGTTFIVALPVAASSDR